MVGISVNAWKAAAAPIRSAPPPRTSIFSTRKFWVAASEAPSRKQATRKPANASGMRGTLTWGVDAGAVSRGIGLIVRQTHVPNVAANGAYTNGIQRSPKPCSRAPDATDDAAQPALVRRRMRAESVRL